jgi:hypothetical protein
VFKRMWEHLKGRFGLGAIASELLDTTVQKVAQGGAEISQALNHQATAYVPYGAAQWPVTPERGDWSERFTSRGQPLGRSQGQDQGM